MLAESPRNIVIKQKYAEIASIRENELSDIEEESSQQESYNNLSLKKESLSISSSSEDDNNINKNEK